jgi:hypothetical protein
VHRAMKAIDYLHLHLLLLAADQVLTESVWQHCDLHSAVGWSTLTLGRLKHWHTMIDKAILRKLALYFCSFSIRSGNKYQLRSHSYLLLMVLQVGTDHCKSVKKVGWHMLLRKVIVIRTLCGGIYDTFFI